MKKKAELKEEIKELYNQLERLTNEKNEEKKRLWQRNVPKAIDECRSVLKRHYGGLVYNIAYEHADESGYWFSFELLGEKGVQHYNVKHNEIVED